MCFGSAPKAPAIVPQGPSQAEIAANRASTELYQQQAQAQQELLSKQLQDQIDAATQQTAALQRKYEMESAAAAADARARSGTYGVTATQTAVPTTAEVTTAAAPKQNPRTSLKISTAGTPVSAGTGLNIGV